jgi:hypothetical protein
LEFGVPYFCKGVEKEQDKRRKIYAKVLLPYAKLLKTSFKQNTMMPTTKSLGGSKKLENCSCNELREKSKLRKIKGYSGLTKSELIKVLRRK